MKKVISVIKFLLLAISLNFALLVATKLSFEEGNPIYLMGFFILMIIGIKVYEKIDLFLDLK